MIEEFKFNENNSSSPQNSMQASSSKNDYGPKSSYMQNSKVSVGDLSSQT